MSLKSLITKQEEVYPEKIHEWYLEAIKELHPESFNPNANDEINNLRE